MEEVEEEVVAVEGVEEVVVELEGLSLLVEAKRAQCHHLKSPSQSQ